MINPGIYETEHINYFQRRIIVYVVKVNRCSIWLEWDGEAPIKYGLSKEGIINDREYDKRYDIKKWKRID
jgi:hypothetical protein